MRLSMLMIVSTRLRSHKQDVLGVERNVGICVCLLLLVEIMILEILTDQL